MTDNPPHLYDDTYTSLRFRYGLHNRPPSGGAVPRGFIVGSHKKGDAWRHGTLDYPAKLTEREAEAYELTYIGEFPTSGETVKQDGI